LKILHLYSKREKPIWKSLSHISGRVPPFFKQLKGELDKAEGEVKLLIETLDENITEKEYTEE
jgi:hypothetical protein